MAWTRVKRFETGGVLGWFEQGTSIITLTKGMAHIVHRGRAFVWYTPEATFSSKPETICDRITRFLK